MKIALINKKGGVGKTPFAFSIAKDLNYFLQSNDNSCIEQIYPNKAKILEKVKELDDCVYDFGGFVAPGVLDIIKKCNVVIIPCLPTYNSFLRTIETINEISPINPNIILLATNFKDDKEEEFLEAELDKRYKNIPTFYFKNSKIINNAVNVGLSFTELYNENSLSRRSYMGFYNEYRRLLKTIKNLA
ncbi:hypothetical protein GZ989_011445 (plasmid) [Campylobacter fetus]|uniref:ParA family protein n=1 Tax=Campylobacter fetus TaxID=196 RepID=A0A974MUY4_CAMFE|nr:hypothetical protein [Campylobacter fetus]OCS32885.1 hypothetical protein AWR31_08065 [Campylobacter fetus subsp. venerealis]QMS59887.1 hypothetical protein GZ989_011445 [Campylobacter fetus]